MNGRTRSCNRATLPSHPAPLYRETLFMLSATLHATDMRRPFVYLTIHVKNEQIYVFVLLTTPSITDKLEWEARA